MKRSKHCTLRAVSLATAGAMIVVFIWILLADRTAVAQQPANIGPERGWLILHGGGINRKQDFEHYHRFVALAGGANASIVVILTPIDLDVITNDFLTKYKEWWKTEFGLADITFMDTRNRQEAESDSFVTPLRKATGVYILGGHLTNLLDIYLGTRTEREIKAVVDRGGVLAGSSAGAMIQGSFLINLTKTPSDLRLSRSGMYVDPARAVGFGLLREIAVYPHVDARHSEKDLFEVIGHYPQLIGIGIDENTAMILHNDQFEVIGDGQVRIFDRDGVVKKKYVSLSKGQKFDLRKRAIIQ
jgi:cyanophycinase